MCPFCLSSLAWIALGGGAGSGTLAALIIGARRRNMKDDDHERSIHRNF